jgi:hypothetical protein
MEWEVIPLVFFLTTWTFCESPSQYLAIVKKKKNEPVDFDQQAIKKFEPMLWRR